VSLRPGGYHCANPKRFARHSSSPPQRVPFFFLTPFGINPAPHFYWLCRYKFLHFDSADIPLLDPPPYGKGRCWTSPFLWAQPNFFRLWGLCEFVPPQFPPELITSSSSPIFFSSRWQPLWSCFPRVSPFRWSFNCSRGPPSFFRGLLTPAIHYSSNHHRCFQPPQEASISWRNCGFAPFKRCFPLDFCYRLANYPT